jgi:hypothetical protein
VKYSFQNFAAIELYDNTRRIVATYNGLRCILSHTGCQSILRIFQLAQQQENQQRSGICIGHDALLGACKSVTEVSLAQDASMKVRRAAFALWLQLHGFPYPDAGLLEVPCCHTDIDNEHKLLCSGSEVLQVLKQRAQDRCESCEPS